MSCEQTAKLELCARTRLRRLHALLIVALLLPLFTNGPSVSSAANPPILISELSSTRAIALESVTFTREPFSLTSPFGASQQRTRIMVFAMNLTLQSGEDLSAVTADAEDGSHRHFPLTVEAIRPVPSHEWMNAVVLKLHDDMGNVGDVLVSVSHNGVKSNRVRLAIGNIGGGPPDDSGAMPTPAPPYTITGKLFNHTGQPLAGISVALSGSQSATVISAADGSYSFTLSSFGDYTVAPAATPYFAFTPQVFNHLQTNRVVNFAGALRSYTVSGQLKDGSKPIVGATVAVSGSQTVNAVTNSNGEYSLSLLAGGNYTITPITNPYYSFTGSNTYLDLVENQVADFAGTLRFYTISGWVQLGPFPAADLEIPITGSTTTSVTTDQNGNYSISLPAGGNYTLTPSVSYYNFDPPSRVINDLTSHQGTQFFFSSRQTFAIRGKLKDLQNNGLAGITVQLSGAELRSAITNANGDYQFSNLLAGFDYHVAVPSTELFTFPAGQNVNALAGDQTVDVVGLHRFLLSGRVLDQNGQGINGVKLTLSGSESATTKTIGDGSYSLRATENGSYTVTPSIPQDYYSFAPANLQLVNLSAPQVTNFAGTLASVSDPHYVLEFNGQPMDVDHFNFWQEGVDLGHFFWEFWAMPGENAAATYLLSDGYGGLHALLFGVSSFNSTEFQRYQLNGNISDGVNAPIFFGSDMGPAINEWGHFAVGWDGQSIVTYFNGVPVGKKIFNGPRRTPGPGNGGGRLLIGGSDHSNFEGRIAQVRGYENSNPRETVPNGMEVSFAPETVFSPGGNLLSKFFRQSDVVADLSNGYNGVAHEGVLRGTVFGVLANCTGCAVPRFVIDPTAPNFATGAAAAPVNVPGHLAPPPGALVFDSFARPNATYSFGGHGGLGSTESGSAGPQAWLSTNAPKTPHPFGVLNARAVLLGNERALAWVPSGSATGDVDVRVNRFNGTWGSGIHTGLSFRVVDGDNFFFAYTTDTADPLNPKAVRVGYYLNGQRTDLTNGVAMPATWTTLRVVTLSSGDLKVYLDGTLVFNTNNTQLSAAIGAGLYNNSAGLGLANRWDNFTVFPAP